MAQRPGEWWIAERAQTSEPIGYVRALRRPGLLELTEFFVRPDAQSQGAGRLLLESAFAASGDEVRSIVATTDQRALARYYGAGTFSQFPILTLTATPRPAGSERVAALRLGSAAAPLTALADIEQAVIGLPRDNSEIVWLQQRDGYLYRRHDRFIGYAFVGTDGAGPIAALDAADLVEILLHVEGVAHAIGVDRLDLELPAVNVIAIKHLLRRGFRIDPWVNLFMSNRPFGRFDRFIGCTPPLFL